MSETKEQLVEQRNALHAKLWRIEAAERREIGRAAVGKCFKYHNSYGSSRPRWWLYSKVIRVSGDNLIAHEFQTDCEGEITINPARKYFRCHMTDGFVEISKAEYSRAWRAVQKRVAGISR